MSAAPSTRAEFTRSLRALIDIFGRRAEPFRRKILDRMDSELRYGDDAVFDHVYQRYCFWQKRQSLDSAAVRLAEGEFFSDVEYAIDNGMKVIDAIEARARERSAQ